MTRTQRVPAMAGPAGGVGAPCTPGHGICTDERAAQLLLDDLARRAESMGRRIESLYAVHGLSRRELVAVQRGIVQLRRAGAAPSANEFWEMTALPRARTLTVVLTEALDCELADIAPVVEGARRRGVPLVAGCPLEGPGAEPIGAVLRTGLPGGDPIDRLGRWWQRRLRRAATVRALPAIALRAPAQAEHEISNVEMLLLDRAPWSHGDRLLSAFELSHAEIVAYGRRRIADLVGHHHHHR